MDLKGNKLRFFAGLLSVFLLLGFSCLAVSQGAARQSQKSVEYMNAFKLYSQKCTGCHNSVADPEKPGRTRDDWYLVVKIMHEYGMDLSDDDADVIITLLYTLRRGMEREAG